MTVKLFIGVVTLLHILGYVALIYWTTRIKAGGDAKEGEIIEHAWDGNLKEMNNPLPGWWLSLFYLMIAVGLVYLVLFPGVFKGVLGWTEVKQYEQESRRFDSKTQQYFHVYKDKTIEELIKMPEALATGRRIFAQNCAVCHASDAGGTPGSYPNLRDKDWLWGGTPEKIIETITHGRIGNMPAGGALIPVDPSNPQPLTAEQKQQLNEVANYVMAMSGYEHNQNLAEKGKVLYDKSCFACHGASGEGNPLLGAPKLSDDTWLYAADDSPEELRKFIEHQIIRPRNNVMPAWKDVLGEYRIKLVAAYVYSLSHDEEDNNVASKQ